MIIPVSISAMGKAERLAAGKGDKHPWSWDFMVYIGIIAI
jgi:hypothetical protein